MSTLLKFSMNTKVTVTGMEVKTKVSSNLLIAADELSSTGKVAETNFGSAISQTVKGYLEPVSTVDAVNFFYTLNAKADGAIQSGATYIPYNVGSSATDDTTYANKFSEDYGVTKTVAGAYATEGDAASAYVDYVFQLKAVATEESYINLTKVFLVDSNAQDTSKAHRIAVFVEDITSGTATAGVGTKQIILTEAGAVNQESGKAVNAVGGTAAVSYGAYADTTLAHITTAETKYYKVVVRLWLEGEDTTCYNDKFLPLTNAWSIDLEISLSTSSTGAATNITKIWTNGAKWYDGTNVYNTLADAESGENGTAIGSVDSAIQDAFGYVAP